jgi:hypothetical protein
MYVKVTGFYTNAPSFRLVFSIAFLSLLYTPKTKDYFATLDSGAGKDS